MTSILCERRWYSSCKIYHCFDEKCTHICKPYRRILSYVCEFDLIRFHWYQRRSDKDPEKFCRTSNHTPQGIAIAVQRDLAFARLQLQRVKGFLTATHEPSFDVMQAEAFKVSDVIKGLYNCELALNKVTNIDLRTEEEKRVDESTLSSRLEKAQAWMGGCGFADGTPVISKGEEGGANNKSPASKKKRKKGFRLDHAKSLAKRRVKERESKGVGEPGGERRKFGAITGLLDVNKEVFTSSKYFDRNDPLMEFYSYESDVLSTEMKCLHEFVDRGRIGPVTRLWVAQSRGQ